ncbi:MAG: MFS transporter [Alphaproteobacteria bacterium]|nr:MFS transporter [Alphaproteobacteria bacterium]
MSGATLPNATAPLADAGDQRRTVGGCCGAHVLHDGYTDLLYVLLPVWQAEFGLGYAEVGMLRALYSGTMASLQVPAGLLAERFGERALLVLGTALAGVGFLVAGASTGFLMLAAGLAIGGMGSSVQHPLGASLIARAFDGSRSRIALGTYNFAGDIGKMALPAATAAMLTVIAWRPVTSLFGLLGLAGALAILFVLPRLPALGPAPAKPVTVAGATRRAGLPVPGRGRHGFPLLLAISMIDSATRMGFLTFLPFLLTAKGADFPAIGIALTLVFAGGAAGKLACGYLGAYLGVFPTVLLTEAATAIGILALLPLSLEAAYALLPVIGIALNGTSSVLYGTVPELVEPARRARAFGVFYTGGIGAGALAPILFGAFSDHVGIDSMMIAVATAVLLTLPLALWLRPAIREAAG